MAEPGEVGVGVAAIDVELSRQPAASSGAPPVPHLLGHKLHEDGLAPPPKLDKDGLAADHFQPEPSEEQDIEAARCVSIQSLVATTVVAVFAFSIGIGEEVLSLVGFGLEALLDGVSSALVLWRFKKGKERLHEDREAAARFRAERDARRERNSGVGIGWSFVASAVFLFVSALLKVTLWNPETPLHEKEERDGAVYSIMLSIPSGLVFGVLAYRKFKLAKALGSQVLEKDALCSMLGALLALICGTAAVIEELSGSDAGMAEVDAVASWIIAAILGVEGVRTLRHNLGVGWAEEHRPMA